MYCDPEEKDIITKEQSLKLTSENALKYIARKDGTLPKFLFSYEYEYIADGMVQIYADSLEEANSKFEELAEGEVEQILNVTKQKVEFEDRRQLKLEI